MADEVLTEAHGRVLLITLNRPQVLNAVDTALSMGLRAAVEQLEGDPGLTIGVVTGTGRGFSSGMDLKAFAEDGPPKGYAEFLAVGSTKPLVAAIEGFALAGGLELALTCDLLVAARGAELGIPEVRVGLCAGGAGLLRLPRRLPYAIAMELALTADSLTAEQAHAYGLVNRLAEPGRAAAVALELAEQVARNAPLAVSASKQIMRQAQGLTEAEGWEMQETYLKPVFDSEDAKEGPRAFAEKRPPVWRGR